MKTYDPTMSVQTWNELSKEAVECALHASNIALAGMRGISMRLLRSMKIAEKNNLARLELLQNETDLQTLVDQETNIIRRNNDEILEDARNLVQVGLFTQSEMTYWYQRFVSIWWNTQK